MSRCVILIVIDCLRADHVSSYGYDRPTTPTIDALAAQGVLWEQAYSLSSWTKPSVASLLTGLYPSQHGAVQGIKRKNDQSGVTTDVIDSSCTTIAEALARAGWVCAAFVNNAQLGEFTGLNRGFETYIPNAGKADRLIALFHEWLEQHRDRNTFIYLHFLEAHWPYKPRRRHIKMFGGDRDTNFFRDYRARDYARLRRAISKEEDALTQDQLEQMVRMYDGAVRRLDGKVKVVLKTLEDLNMRDETAVVITADHGEEFLDHGHIGHGQSLYDELTHVPLIACVPGGPCGVRRDAPVSQVDLPRTLMGLAGLNGWLPGTDLLANESESRPVCSELRFRSRYTQTIRSANWKLHRRYKFELPDDRADISPPTNVCLEQYPYRVNHRLFDLDSDPREQDNLSSVAEYQNIRADLEAKLDRWWQEIAPLHADQSATEVEIDDQVVRRLRDLGYLE